MSVQQDGVFFIQRFIQMVNGFGDSGNIFLLFLMSRLCCSHVVEAMLTGLCCLRDDKAPWLEIAGFAEVS